VAVAAAGPAAGPAAAAEEEKTEFDVVLKDVGAEKIKVIKVVRELTGLGLKEAKDLVDGAPSTVKEAVAKEEAEGMVAKLKEVGATAELK
jgi:large subunit ribosomal protein L7/L12